jgi:threonine dehydratase
MPDVTLRDLYRARRAIAPHVRRTPLIASPALSRLADREVFLKLENQQPTGAFKVRGAASKLTGLTSAERGRGVVAVSTGNHGRAVAHVGRALGIRVTVCLSERVPAVKREPIEALGAEVRIAGASQDEAMIAGAELAAAGMVLVPPFDDPAVIAGQGTIGLEIVEDLPELGAVLVPLSGGGLLAGIAVAVKGIDPAIRTIGASAERVAVMRASIAAGAPVTMDEEPSLADSLGGGLGEPNRYTFRLVRDLVDDHAVVSEEQIAEAMRFCFRYHGLVLEGAGAVGVAALLAGELELPPGPVAIVISGSNVDPDEFLAAVG